MNLVFDLVGFSLVVVGLVFMVLGALGLVTLPDFFSRTHAASKVDTVGVAAVALGIAFIEGVTFDSLKVLLVALFVVISTPVASHALARAAIRNGLKPWVGGPEKDDKPTQE